MGQDSRMDDPAVRTISAIDKLKGLGAGWDSYGAHKVAASSQKMAQGSSYLVLRNGKIIERGPIDHPDFVARDVVKRLFRA